MVYFLPILKVYSLGFDGDLNVMFYFALHRFPVVSGEFSIYIFLLGWSNMHSSNSHRERHQEAQDQIT